ncbi:MAG TPA: prephenate dehydrogenase/arogenate dehydrogenase family protein [Polyangiaceae bacterium]|nr:prephenate dehydrogenase/arogenate dehydrogenase family protein [Polyangiaceae bacterium]
MRLALVGFGLIGGSVALAARGRALASHVVGVDRADVVDLPEARRAADELVDAADLPRVRGALGDADLVVVATPVGAIEASIGAILDASRTVTDCGSTKRAIVASARTSPKRGRFVPGHPMAGLPEGGIRRARADLFEGRPWLLCAEHSDPDATELVERLVRGVGAEPVRLTAEEHDRAVALTSHVPQVLASALAVLAESRHAGVAAGPGFESATRVAGGGEAMWRDILASNADEISVTLDALGDELSLVARGLKRTPPDLGPALRLLERARALRLPKG